MYISWFSSESAFSFIWSSSDFQKNTPLIGNILIHTTVNTKAICLCQSKVLITYISFLVYGNNKFNKKKKLTTRATDQSNAVSLTKTNTWLQRWLKLRNTLLDKKWHRYKTVVKVSCTPLLSLKDRLRDVCFGSRLLLPCRSLRERDAKIRTKITRAIYHDVTEYVVSC